MAFAQNHLFHRNVGMHLPKAFTADGDLILTQLVRAADSVTLLGTKNDCQHALQLAFDCLPGNQPLLGDERLVQSLGKRG